LGYYPDGVKRTLTDEQIAIFRHSEIQTLLRERRKRREEAALQQVSPEAEAPSEPGTEHEFVQVPQFRSSSGFNPKTASEPMPESESDVDMEDDEAAQQDELEDDIDPMSPVLSTGVSDGTSQRSGQHNRTAKERKNRNHRNRNRTRQNQKLRTKLALAGSGYAVDTRPKTHRRIAREEDEVQTTIEYLTYDDEDALFRDGDASAARNAPLANDSSQGMSKKAFLWPQIHSNGPVLDY
jgi:hypothetical protein